MRAGHPSERPIYIPKGRRELIEATSAINSKLPPVSKIKSHSKRPMTEENDVVEDKVHRHTRQKSNGQIVENCSSVVPPPARTAPVARTGVVELYVPKAKREQMEKDAAREVATGSAKLSNKASTPSAFVSKESSSSVPEGAGRMGVGSNTVTEQPIRTSKQHTLSPSPCEPIIPISSLNISSTNSSTMAVPSTTTTTTTTTTTKPREAVRGGLYVPKGRRDLNEKKAAELPPPPVAVRTATAVSIARTLTPPPAPVPVPVSLPSKGDDSPPEQWDKFTEDGECEDNPIRKAKVVSKTHTSWDESSDEEDADECKNNNNSSGSRASGNYPSAPPAPPAPPALSLEETIERCTLLLSGVPAEMSEMARGNVVRVYLDKGATSRWVTAGECLLMFKTERTAASAVPGLGCSIFRVVRLKDVSSPRKEELIAVARETFTVSKPERDSTVANRLIGAALGIRLPKPQNATNSNSSSSYSGNSNISRARAPSPVREDAWDD